MAGAVRHKADLFRVRLLLRPLFIQDRTDHAHQINIARFILGSVLAVACLNGELLKSKIKESVINIILILIFNTNDWHLSQIPFLMINIHIFKLIEG